MNASTITAALGAALALAFAAPAAVHAAAEEPAAGTPAPGLAAEAPKLLVLHVPPASVEGDAPLVVTATIRNPDTADVVLQWRRRGSADWRTSLFVRGGPSAWTATIAVADLVPGEAIEYYVASRPRGVTKGPERLHFASPERPHVVPVVGEPEARTRRALLALHEGNRSRFSATGEFVTFGSRSLSDGSDVFDHYWRAEADYTYRILSPVYSVRLGVGLIRGATYDIGFDAEGDPIRVPVELCEERPGRLCVGLTYGFAEVRFRLWRLMRLDVKATLGAGPRVFEGGGGGTLVIGNDPGTHVAFGFEGVTAIGVRGFLRLAWTTVPRVPMSLTLEVNNLPDATDVSGRVYLSAEYHFGRHIIAGASVGYATRDFAIGGPTGGLTLATEF